MGLSAGGSQQIGSQSSSSTFRGSNSRSSQMRSQSPPNGAHHHHHHHPHHRSLIAQRVEESESSDSSASEDGNVVRVGREYQAVVPKLDLVQPKPAPDSIPDHAVLVWSPYNNLTEDELEDYINCAKEKYNYNMEQALGMLCWHKFDLKKANVDLPNFTPFPDEWSVEDKVLFEQAYQFHDKNFHKIRAMLPEKSIASLVKYYYGWKKTRSRTSLMDRQARKLKEDQKGDASGSDEEEVDDEADNDSEVRVQEGKPRCENCCTTATAQFHHTNKGMLCSACYSFWRRTGTMKCSGGKRQSSQILSSSAESGASSSAASSSQRPVLNKPQKRKPPRGMYINKEDLKELATGPAGTGENMLRALDQEIVNLKRMVQNNKQIISQMKHKISLETATADFSAPDMKIRPNWTKDEELLAVQALRKYGKNFQTVAEIIGNKTEVHVRQFYATNERRYQLDKVIEQYNKQYNSSENRDDENIDPVPGPTTAPATQSSSSQSTTSSKRMRSSATTAAD